VGRSTRRRFLAGAGAALGAVSIPEAQAASRRSAGRAAEADTVPFYGRHQAGISTPAQEHLQFGAFDLVTDSVDDLRGLLRTWSRAAARIASGQPVGPHQTEDRTPVDTGEAVGLSPARVTVTFGFGPGVFGRRFGLGRLRPDPLVKLPHFSHDALEQRISGGDLAIQVCADDPQVAFHALHDLIRLAHGSARPRWLLAGFGRTGNSRAPTPRNLMGFKDGTANIVADDAAALKKFVWASGHESPGWMHGGTYMIVRRIKIGLGDWDARSLHDQEATLGRHKLSGAPLGGRHEHDPINLGAQHHGSLVIPFDAHVRLASQGYNNGQRILRRGYSYVDGVEGHSAAAGQLFICYQRDPRKQFIPIQRRLSRDALNHFTTHVGSAIFACPPGPQTGGYVGEGLLG
jgi:deferrochelatase/peroxidase EfeB